MQKVAQFKREIAGVSALAAAVPAFAVDTTAVTAAIGDAATAGATIGLAVLVMIVGIKVFKWVRGAM